MVETVGVGFRSRTLVRASSHGSDAAHKWAPGVFRHSTPTVRYKTRCVLSFQFPQTKKASHSRSPFYLVETVGVEPTSESYPSPESTCVVCNLD
jgi:hypothetical protein